MRALLPTLGILLTLLTAARAQEFSVRADAPERAAAIERMVEKGLAKLTPHFPRMPVRPFTVVVHPDGDGLTPELRAAVHPGTAGFARLEAQEIHLMLAEARRAPPNDLQTVVEHELVHLLLHQFAGPGGPHVPRWFHEGLAQALSGGPYLGISEEALVYRIWSNSLIPFRALVEDFPRDDEGELQAAYGQSFSFVSYLWREIGLEVLLAAARECSAERPFAAAVAVRMERGLVQYEDAWREHVLHASGALWRILLRESFTYLMLLAVPIAILALLRKLARERRIRARLDALDAPPLPREDPAP